MTQAGTEAGAERWNPNKHIYIQHKCLRCFLQASIGTAHKAPLPSPKLKWLSVESNLRGRRIVEAKQPKGTVRYDKDNDEELDSAIRLESQVIYECDIDDAARETIKQEAKQLGFLWLEKPKDNTRFARGAFGTGLCSNNARKMM